MSTLLTNSNPTKSQIEKISPFIMYEWLSNNQTTVIPGNMMNINYKMPIYNQYRFLDDYFTLTGIKRKIKYIPFVKKQKQDPDYIKNIEGLQKYYNINYQDAQKYYELLSKDEIKRINEIYNEGQI